MHWEWSRNEQKIKLLWVRCILLNKTCENMLDNVCCIRKVKRSKAQMLLNKTIRKKPKSVGFCSYQRVSVRRKTFNISLLPFLRLIFWRSFCATLLGTTPHPLYNITSSYTSKYLIPNFEFHNLFSYSFNNT